MKIHLVVLVIVSLDMSTSTPTLGMTSSPSFSIQEIKSASGLFYQNLGPAFVYTNYIVLGAIKNLTHYEEKLNQLIEVFERSKAICEPAEHLYCFNSMNMLESEIPSLRQKFNSILHLSGQHALRRRRGVVNAIGTGFKWLFGTPDAADAEQYSRNIDFLFSQNQDTRQLMHEQVQILTSTIDSYNRSVAELRRNTDILNGNIHEIVRANAGLVKSLHALEENTMAIKHVTLLTQLMVHLSAELDEIINALLFAKQSILHPSIITPDDLRKELLKVTVNPDLRLPIALESNDTFLLYFDIMQISVALKGNNLIYYLRIPTPFTEQYALYHMIPLPNYYHPKIFSFIVPQHPYLLINLPGDQFNLLDTLSTCKKLKDYYICKSHTQSKAFADTCEVQLQQGHVTKLPEDCTTKTIVGNMEVWQEINHNEWLYSLSSQTNATVLCSNIHNITNIQLNGTGILRLEAGCEFQAGDTTLHAYTAPTCNYTHFVPSIDIRTNMAIAEREESLTHLYIQNITWRNTNLEELQHAKHRFKETMNTTRPYHVSQSDRILNVAVFIVIVVAISVLACYRRCKCCRCAKAGEQRNNTDRQ